MMDFYFEDELIVFEDGDYDAAFYSDGETISICEKLYLPEEDVEVVTMTILVI